MPFIYPSSKFNFSGKTLIVPIVSTANVAQLAADLLISTLSLKRIAAVDPRFFVPVVGGRDDGEEGITTPLELYWNDTSDIAIFLQRSPVLKSLKQDFIDSLLEFVGSSNAAAVLFLSGVDLSNRTDSQMFTSTYHIVPPSSPNITASLLKAISNLQIPVYSSPVSQRNPTEDKQIEIPFIPGGGLTRRMLSSLPSSWPIPTASILQFVLEGDNRADANMLATITARILDLPIKQWNPPQSWREGLFGAPHDQTLYG
ncbi:PAC2 family-domain-containing protein [Cyathus striatus]|nr:PAC2 family-domain-containing protein [Cyathus striatus]